MGKRKYCINENYFNEIDSHNKAYYLGFITADGYNYTKKGTIVITQSGIQSDIIFKLNAEIGSNAPIINKPNKTNQQKIYELRINSRKISNILSSYGIIQKKSHETYFPNISEEFYNSYILGYYDGDGGINFSKNNYNNSIINFTGNESLINKIKEIIDNKFNRNGTISIRHKNKPNIITLNYTGKRSCYKILTWLYNDSTLFIDSKKDKYEYLIHLIEDVEDRKKAREEKKKIAIAQKKLTIDLNNQKKKNIDDEILNHLIDGFSIHQIKIKFKRNSAYIRNIINKNEIDYGKRRRMFAIDPNAKHKNNI